MKYIITPTDKDVLHYAKGSESKAHKYVSRVFKNGKWIYTYAKNRLRGNKVTNKDGKEQYSPNEKFRTVTNKDGNSQYAPNIKTDASSFFTGEEGQLREYNVLRESWDSDQAAYGYSVFNRVLDSHRGKPMVTNNIPIYRYDSNGNLKVDKSYTPPEKKTVTTASRGKAYNPTGGKHTSINNKHYTPTATKTDLGTGEYRGIVEGTDKKKRKSYKLFDKKHR